VAISSGGLLDSVMFLILVTLLLTIGLSLSMVAFEGQDLIRTWFNLCNLEVGKEYAKYGFSYYVTLEMKPGEYVDEQKIKARVFDNIGKEPNIPNCTKYPSGYYKDFYWAKPGEVQLITHDNMPKTAYPSLLVVDVNDDYPTPPYDAPSLAYLNPFSGSVDAGLVYLSAIYPISKISTGNMIFGKEDVYITYPTTNYVVVKFSPGEHIGEAKMERVGVLMFGRMPAPMEWFRTIGSLTIPQPFRAINSSSNVVAWYGEKGEGQRLN
jgi:hypothetical protein